MSLTNELPGQENTVLAGTSAVFRVSVKDAAGNPAANQTAVITLKRDSDTFTGSKDYEVSDATTVVTTDANGNATFVAKPKVDTAVKNDDTDYVGAYKYTVKVNEESKEGILKVAAIVYGAQSDKSVANLNGVDPYKDIYSDIAPGSNVNVGGDNGQAKRWTTNMKKKTAEYIGAQQVSPSGSDKNKVAFRTDVFLRIPAYKGDKEPAKEATQELNLKSEKYHTYASSASTTQSAELEQKNLSDVAYATVRFNSLKLSKHTKAVVTLHYPNYRTKEVKTYGYDDVTAEDKDFGLQLSKDQLKDALSISFSLEAQGQVDLDSNDGYDVKDIVYVFNSQKGTDAEDVHYDGVKVDWAIEDKVYYDDEIQLQTKGTPVTFSAEDVKNGKAAYYDESKADGSRLVINAAQIVTAIEGLAESEANCYNITYSAPAFPDNGNAIIRCYDRNNNVKKIFACATINSGENVNLLYFNSTDTKQNLLYEITEQEAKNNGADCKIVETDPEKGLVVVNSEKSGITHLKGTVSSDDPKIQAALDAENTHVYTSVMWNPVIDSSKNAAGIAFAGQTATVVAQLIDDNGNPVAQPGQKITWTYPNLDSKGVKKVDEQTSTNQNGQATLKLSAANAVELIGVNASTTSGYKVKLILAHEESTKGADIYWVDLGLGYRASALTEDKNNDAYTMGTDGINNYSATNGTASGNAAAKVGEKWEYASKVMGYTTNNRIKFQEKAGALYDKQIKAVTGIVPTLSKKPSSKGTVDIDAKEGRATVTSNEVTDNSAIIFRLNASNSPKADATILVGDQTYALIGTGAISANETLTLNYNFETVGSEIGFILPNGNKSAKKATTPATPDEQIVYLQLRDSKGNPIKLKDENASNDSKKRIKVSVTSNSKKARIEAINAMTDGYDNINAYVSSSDTTAKSDYLLKSEETGYADENDTDISTGKAGSTEVVYTDFSKVSKYSNGSLVAGTDPNTDGILAIKLTDEAKEDVVVTASYEEVKGTKPSGTATDERKVNVLATQTQTYSFIDEANLPVFGFDTAQDNGKNRIFYDSDKNEITVAFKNDLLASSVKADQFIVQKGAKSDLDAANVGNVDTLVVKDVTVDGNKVVIKLIGSITDVTKATYFKVLIGRDGSDVSDVLTFDKNIRYIFTSADGQELPVLGTDVKKSIVFPANSKISIAEQFETHAENKFASPAKDWTSASDIEETVHLLALAGVNIPLDNDTAAYLQAIQIKASALSGGATLANIQKVLKDAIEDVQESKKIAEEAIGTLSFKSKRFKGKALKGADLNKTNAIGIAVKNTAVAAASASGPAMSVSVTTSGAGIGVAYGTATSTNPTVGETTLNPGASGTVYLQAEDETVSNAVVTITIKTTYYTRTYEISDFKVRKDANGNILITGGTIKDEIVVDYNSTVSPAVS